MNSIQSSVNTSANGMTGAGILSGAGTAAAKASNWLDENSFAIGAGCAIATFLLAAIFHFVNSWMNSYYARKRQESENAFKKAEFIAERTSAGDTPEQINRYLKLAGIEDAS